MPEFDSDGVRLHYVLAGPGGGRPIVLVHGFCSDYQLNWVGTRWEQMLTEAGCLILGLDCRGHGSSGKPHQPAAYDREVMAGDVIRLLDHLGVASADYLGYSMGANIGLLAAARHGTRLRKAVLGGVASWDANSHADLIARRFRGDTTVTDPAAVSFYEFAAARPINDLEALACCILGHQPRLDDQALGSITVPILLVAGDKDPIARRAADLAARIPTASFVALEGRNHMNAVPARHFKQAALGFLSAG